jgi:hypothetical protein
MTITQSIAVAISRKFLQQKFHAMSRLYKDTITIMNNSDYMRVIRQHHTHDTCTIEQYYTGYEQTMCIHAYYSAHLSTAERDCKVSFYPAIEVQAQYHVYIPHATVEIFNASEFSQIEHVETPFTMDIDHRKTRCFMVSLKRENTRNFSATLPPEWETARVNAEKALEDRKNTPAPLPEQHTIDRIKSIPGWDTDIYLLSFISRLEIGKKLTARQEKTLEGKERKAGKK